MCDTVRETMTGIVGVNSKKIERVKDGGTRKALRFCIINDVWKGRTQKEDEE